MAAHNQYRLLNVYSTVIVSSLILLLFVWGATYAQKLFEQRDWLQHEGVFVTSKALVEALELELGRTELKTFEFQQSARSVLIEQLRTNQVLVNYIDLQTPAVKKIRELRNDLNYSRSRMDVCYATGGDNCEHELYQLRDAIEKFEIVLNQEVQSRLVQTPFGGDARLIGAVNTELEAWNRRFQRLVSELEFYMRYPSEKQKTFVQRFYYSIDQPSFILNPPPQLLKIIPSLADKLDRLKQDIALVKLITEDIIQLPLLKNVPLQDIRALSEHRMSGLNLQSFLIVELMKSAKQEYEQSWSYFWMGFAVHIVIILMALLAIQFIRVMAVVPLEKNKIIIEQAPIGFIEVSPKGRIKRVNIEVLNIFGYMQEDLLSANISLLFAEDSLTRLLDAFLQQSHKNSAQTSVRMELVALDGRGREVPVEVSVEKVEYANKLEFILLITELTEARQQQLRERKRIELSQILRDATESVVAHTQEDRQVWLRLVKAVRNLIQADVMFVLEVNHESPNEGFKILACEGDVLFPSKDLPEKVMVGLSEKLIEIVQKDAFVSAAEVPIIKSIFDEISPKEADLQSLIVPIYNANELVGLYGIRIATVYMPGLFDFLEPLTTTSAVIFENKLYEEQQTVLMQRLSVKTTEAMRAKNVAEKAVKAKSLFLANMSHEIRTPLNAVLGMAQLLTQTSLSPQQLDYVTKLHRAGGSLMEVINQILDFSKIEAGSFELENRPFELESVVSDLVGLFVNAAREKGVELLADFQAPNMLGKRGKVVGDAPRIQQVLTNLIGNALKFTESGHVSLEVRAHLRGHFADVTFAVVDTGIGIEEKAQQKLFQEFTQADESTTRRFGGTGLGLAISQKIIKLMGSEITLQSQPDVGSRFEFQLRLPMARELSKAVNYDFTGRTAVILEDSTLAGRILSEQLHEAKFDVHHYTSMADVLRWFESGRDADCLLLDWFLRRGTAETMLEWLHANRPDILRKTLIVSSFFSEHIQDAMDQYQLGGYVAKPILPTSLYENIEQLFNGGVSHEDSMQSDIEHINLSGLRVLLVEDNVLNQQIAQEFLFSKNADVVTVNNGKEAVERITTAGEIEFDVVLMDLQMPVMGGHEATQIIRDDGRFDDLPIIAMTAHAFSEEVEKSRAMGMNNYITKPIDAKTFYNVLNDVNQNKSRS